MLAVLAIGLVFIVLARRGLDLFSMALAGLVFYYYPILAFDNIVWLSEGMVSSSSVDDVAAVVIFSLVFLYAIWAYFSPMYSVEKFVFSKKKLILLSRVSLLVSVVFVIVLLYKYKIYGNGSKADFMAVITYELKIYESAAAIYIICSHVLNCYVRRAIGTLLAVVALYIGFRFLVAFFVVSYFVVRPIRSWAKVFYSVFGISIVVVVAVFSKIFYYGIPDFDMIEGILSSQLKGNDFFQNILIANAESSSVSVVFNEVLKSDFMIGFEYWVNVVTSLIPAASLFGLGGVSGFSDMYKSILSVGGVESFAGSMYGLGYAAFGYAGIALFAFVHLIFMYAGYRFVCGRSSTYIKILLLYFLVISVFFGHRNDIIYNISLVKSAFGVILICFLLDTFLRAFLSSDAVSRWCESDENRIPY